MKSLKIKKEMVSLRIPEKINQKLSQYVKERGITKNSFILGLLSKELEIKSLD